MLVYQRVTSTEMVDNSIRLSEGSLTFDSSLSALLWSEKSHANPDACTSLTQYHLSRGICSPACSDDIWTTVAWNILIMLSLEGLLKSISTMRAIFDVVLLLFHVVDFSLEGLLKSISTMRAIFWCCLTGMFLFVIMISNINRTEKGQKARQVLRPTMAGSRPQDQTGRWNHILHICPHFALQTYLKSS